MKRIAAITLLIASAAMTASAADSAKLSGYISDSMCGAKHMGTGAACVKQCIKNGMKPVFVDEANKQVWSIENPDAVKDFYGDHVAVTANANSSNKSVVIESISIKK
ncbi:MAG: hypothetical protein KGN79_08510 [Acidobacteriota bacterium]|nr:hypothetical protein [Acidobacteriota bacterium]